MKILYAFSMDATGSVSLAINIKYAIIYYETMVGRVSATILIEIKAAAIHQDDMGVAAVKSNII